MGHTAGTERPVDIMKKPTTNYAYNPLLFLCMQEFVPKRSDNESDVFKAVSCLVPCLLKSKSNNRCALCICAVHYIHTVWASAFS